MTGSSYRKKLRESEQLPEEESFGTKKEIQKKRQRRRLTEEQKKVSKLSFDDEGGLLSGAGTGRGRTSVGIGAAVAGSMIHGKLKEAEDDNAALEGAHASEIAAEEAVKSLRRVQVRNKRSLGRLKENVYQTSEIPGEGRLKFGEGNPEVEAAKVKEATKKRERQKEMNKFWQRKKYKDSYIAARRGKKVGDAAGTAGGTVTESFVEKAKRATEEIFRKNKVIFIGISFFALFFLFTNIF